MKKLLLIPLVFFLAVALRAETINLREFGQLTFILDPAWKVSSEDMGDSYQVSISSKTGANAGCAMTIVIKPGKDTDTKAKLRTRLIEGSQKDADQSVEKRVVPKELFMKAGYGFYADFTDPNLVGKPPVKNDFKVQTLAMVRLNDEVGVIANILSDGFRETAHLQLLSAIESMEVLPPKTATPAKK